MFARVTVTAWLYLVRYLWSSRAGSSDGAEGVEGGARCRPERGSAARGAGQRQVRHLRPHHARPRRRPLHLVLLAHPPILPHQDGPVLRREVGRDPVPAGDRHGQVRDQIPGKTATRSKTWRDFLEFMDLFFPFHCPNHATYHYVLANLPSPFSWSAGGRHLSKALNGFFSHLFGLRSVRLLATT